MSRFLKCSIRTMVSGNTESLIYVGYDGTCWLTMILENTHLEECCRNCVFFTKKICLVTLEKSRNTEYA